MKKILFGAAFAAMVFAACNKVEVSEDMTPTVVREYTAVINDEAADTDTKVSFGTVSGDGTKISASWTVGDKIALTDGTTVVEATVSSLDGANATLTAEVAESFNPTAAYYPYDSYDQTNKAFKTVATTQVYGESLPVYLQGALVDGSSTFFEFTPATTAGSYTTSVGTGSEKRDTTIVYKGTAVVSYNLTGDIKITEAYLYYKTWNNDIFVNGNEKPDFTLTMGEGLQLSSTPQKLSFVVPVEENAEKLIVLEIKAAAPSNAYGSAEYSYYLRKTSGVTLTSGSYNEMPVMDYTQSNITPTNRVIWTFGSEGNISSSEWTAWVPSKSDVDKNGSTDASINYTAGANYATVTMGKQKVSDISYRGDLLFKGTNSTSVNIGSYRFFAFKSNAGKVIDGTVFPAGSVKKANGSIKFDIGGSGLGQWRQTSSGKSTTVTSNTTNCEIWVYDMLSRFGNTSSYGFAPTATPLEIKGTMTFKIADLKYEAYGETAPSYDIYWAGFFNSIEEIEAYVAETETTASTDTSAN